MFSYIWNKIKSWTGWDKAGTIVLARLTSLVGLVSAGALAIDWSKIISMDFTNAATNKQALIAGGIMFAYGISLELTRRHNANL